MKTNREGNNTSEKRKVLVSCSLVLVSLILVIGNVVSYNSSVLLSRIVVFVTFIVLLVTLISSENRSNSVKLIGITLAISCGFFLLWRSGILTGTFLDWASNSETVLLSQQYDVNNHLVFGSAHSYFFLQPTILHCLCVIAGFSSDTVGYISLMLFGSLAAMISFLFYRRLKRYLEPVISGSNLNLILPLIALSLISFAFSERSFKGTNFALMLTLAALWFVFTTKINSRSKSLVFLLLIIGISIGDTNGILVAVPFFLLYALFSRKHTFAVYGLIPLSYLVFSAGSYATSLQNYAQFALMGVYNFASEIVSGNLPGRIVPWGRTGTRLPEDVIVSSVGYLALLVFSLVIWFLLLFLWVRDRKRGIIKLENARSRAGLTCVLLWLTIAGMTYIGSSFTPETFFSDIRTIAIVLLSLPLPFLFASKRLFLFLKRRRVVTVCLAALIIVASIRTFYEVYPKSVNDPIYAVEDSRLGSAGVYIIADFVNDHYTEGGIVADYKVLNRIGKFLPESQYEKRVLDETTLTRPFTRFANNSILIFNVAGLEYPSVYHSPEAYMAAYNVSLFNNRVYDNGIVTIVTLENTKP